MLYKTTVVLSLFEINTLLKILEEKINEEDSQLDVLESIYKKLENDMGKIAFRKKDDVNKVLKNQRNLYMKRVNKIKRKEKRNE